MSNPSRVRKLFISGFLLLSLALPTLAAAPATPPTHDHAAMLSQSSAPLTPTGSFFSNLLETYTPRRICMNLESDVIYLNLISDAVIAISYFTIPVALIYLVRKRRDIAFNWVFVAFATFIIACGVTHVFNVIAIWHPVYRLDGVVKAITALASVITAIAIWPLVPKAIALPSPSALREVNQELQQMATALEQRVQDRTRELEIANASLREQIQKRETAEFAQARLAAIVESSSDAIIGKSLDGTITDWNAAARDTFGYTSDEIIGKSILTLVPPERHAEEMEILTLISRGERVAHFQTERCRKDGTRLHISLSASPIKDPSGKLVGASKIARDVTPQRRAEEERERLFLSEKSARAEAEHASRLKDEFVATLSHELRTPINAVLGWTHLLQSPTTTPADLAEGLPIIERNVRVQVRLIEDLLDMSRILSGKLRLDVQPVDLAAVIENAIQTVTPSANAKNIRIHKLIDPVASRVSGDPNRLQQVVWNLLANAIKFTPKGGRIQAKLERVNSHIEIVVADSGIGINPDFLPHVFERFRQADGSTTRAHGGLGLGLSIAKHLAELHGGSVLAHSAGEGQGSTFFVMLPLPSVHDPRPTSERIHPTAADAPPDIVSPTLTSLKILVIDDEPDARLLIKRVLEGAGARVVVAGSARDGCDRVKEERPDLVISDIGMPEEDGYSFIRKLRSMSVAEGGSVPAIALTAFARPEDRRKALLLGFQMHLPKPCDPSELLAVVASVAGLTPKPGKDTPYT